MKRMLELHCNSVLFVTDQTLYNLLLDQSLFLPAQQVNVIELVSMYIYIYIQVIEKNLLVNERRRCRNG